MSTPTPPSPLAEASPPGGPASNSELDAVRILIINDTPAIHDDFRKILGEISTASLDQAAAELFGEAPATSHRTRFVLDSAYQGEEGLALVSRALAEGRPYALAMVDVRMPPGWDGIETVTHLWATDPSLQVVICTAYSDYSWDEMINRLGETDSLVLLKKPFEAVEVLQLAHALTKKWKLTQQSRTRLADLDAMVKERTRELRASNAKLQHSTSDGEPGLLHFQQLHHALAGQGQRRHRECPGATGTAVHADRAVLLCLTPDGRSFDSTHLWSIGAEDHPPRLKNVGLNTFPYWSRKLAKLETIRAWTLDDLPADAAPEKEFLLSLGSIHLGRAPGLWQSRHRLSGYQLFAPRQIWAEEDDALLKTVGEILAGALQHAGAEQRLQLQSAALESAADAILITDPGGIMLWHNPAFARLTGYAASQIIGKKSNLLKSGKQRPEVYTELWRTITWAKSGAGRSSTGARTAASTPSRLPSLPCAAIRGRFRTTWRSNRM